MKISQGYEYSVEEGTKLDNEVVELRAEKAVVALQVRIRFKAQLPNSNG